jgi:hypothetical protein
MRRGAADGERPVKGKDQPQRFHLRTAENPRYARTPPLQPASCSAEKGKRASGRGVAAYQESQESVDGDGDGGGSLAEGVVGVEGVGG